MTASISSVDPGVSLSAGVSAIVPFPNLTPDALCNIRRVYEALASNRDTLGVLFALDAAQTAPTEQWVTFFVETASSQLLWEQRPTGRLSAEDARWVVARFDEAPTVAAIAVLARLLEEAHELPAWFPAEVRQRAGLFGIRSRGAREQGNRAPHLRLVA